MLSGNFRANAGIGTENVKNTCVEWFGERQREWKGLSECQKMEPEPKKNWGNRHRSHHRALPAGSAFGARSPLLRWSQECFLARPSWSSALETFRSQFQEIGGLVGEGLPVLAVSYSLDCHDLYL